MKMTIMKGLPASGKSTKAEQVICERGNTVRINKDLLRKMLHFDVFSRQNEEKTRLAARALARLSLAAGTHVIIDDTNLNAGTMESWKAFATELGASVEVIDLTDVPVDECVRRDAARENSVGGVVIKNMALRSGLVMFPDRSIVLSDIDGTISDPTHRQHYLEGEKKDWKGFFSDMDKDPVREEVEALLLMHHYHDGRTVIFISARPDTYRDVTLEWLRQKGLDFAYTLIMRPAHDKRSDTDVKKEMFMRHFPNPDVIHVVYDDRPSIIRMWREMGLSVVDVGAGVEF